MRSDAPHLDRDKQAPTATDDGSQVSIVLELILKWVRTSGLILLLSSPKLRTGRPQQFLTASALSCSQISAKSYTNLRSMRQCKRIILAASH